MAWLPHNSGRRACLASFGGGFLALPDWADGLLHGAVPLVRTALAAPRCLLERNGLVSPSRGRFNPTAGGTIGGLHCEPVGPAMLVGSRLDDSLLVVSGQGGLVQRIAPDGGEVWRKSLTQPRGLLTAGPYVLVGSGRSIFWLDKRDGSTAGQTRLDWPVNSFSLYKGVLAVAFRRQGKGAVCLYRLRGFNVVEAKTVPEALNYPRGVHLTGDTLFIADTFGHKVLRFDGHSLHFSKRSAQMESFYPNSVRPFGRQGLLVAEEHINQIALVEPDYLRRQPAKAGCWSHGKNVPLAALLARVNDHDSNGESVCRARGQMGYELLAPNDAVRSNTALYIADTDNHRVLMYKNGTPVAVLSNFNEPVNVEIVS